MVSSDSLHNRHLDSLILITSFVPLPNSSHYFFLYHLFFATALASLPYFPFTALFFLLLAFLFSLSLALSIWICACSSHSFFSFLSLVLAVLFFVNWLSLHARLKSHYEAWSYTKKSSTKKLQHTGNMLHLHLKGVC